MLAWRLCSIAGRSPLRHSTIETMYPFPTWFLILTRFFVAIFNDYVLTHCVPPAARGTALVVVRGRRGPLHPAFLMGEENRRGALNAPRLTGRCSKTRQTAPSRLARVGVVCIRLGLNHDAIAHVELVVLKLSILCVCAPPLSSREARAETGAEGFSTPSDGGRGRQTNRQRDT